MPPLHVAAAIEQLREVDPQFVVDYLNTVERGVQNAIDGVVRELGCEERMAISVFDVAHRHGLITSADKWTLTAAGHSVLSAFTKRLSAEKKSKIWGSW